MIAATVSPLSHYPSRVPCLGVAFLETVAVHCFACEETPTVVYYRDAAAGTSIALCVACAVVSDALGDGRDEAALLARCNS